MRPPFDMAPPLSDDVLKAILQVCIAEPAALGAMRKDVLKFWASRADELDEKEKELYRKAHPAVQACWANGPGVSGREPGPWRGKRTLLLEEMCEAAGLRCGPLLAAYTRAGAPVCGEVPPCGLFEPLLRLPTKSLKDALSAGRWAKHVVKGSTASSGSAHVDDEVYARCLEEVERGGAVGPLCEEEVDQLLGMHWTTMLRFGVDQGSVRAVDSMSEFGQNATSHTHEYVAQAGIDGVAGVAKVYGNLLSQEWPSVTLGSGVRIGVGEPGLTAARRTGLCVAGPWTSGGPSSRSRPRRPKGPSALRPCGIRCASG